MFAQEFKNNVLLQWALSALVFVYFIVFDGWIRDTVFTKEAFEQFRYVCPPYFQSCGDLYILEALPLGYSQTILYMVFFGILAWCVYLIYRKEWDVVQLCLMPIFIWHAANTFLFSDFRAGNYEYYVVAFGLVLLFFPHKEFFLKLTLVIFYSLSTVSKIHPGWVEGGYFTALRTGLPLFPDWSIPLWTNLVIFMEMVGAWFLLSRNVILQRGALLFFTIFHIYSGILVEYRYPATVLPFVLIAFGPLYRYTKVPLDMKSIVGWSFIALLIILQFSPKFITGDEKITAEGNKYGLYMFEANHQCFSEAKIYYDNGESKEENFSQISSRNRCEPYHRWFRFKQLCERKDKISRIEWEFNHSLNGGPFYKIVDVDNVCSLEYSSIRHNTWIKLPTEAAAVGYPVKNIFY
jgi:hypothetical protein